MRVVMPRRPARFLQRSGGVLAQDKRKRRQPNHEEAGTGEERSSEVRPG